MKAKTLSATFILATGFVLLLYNGGSRFTMGLMLKPMADELNWTRATLSLTVTLFMVISAVVLPVIGRLVDRYRIRTVLLASVLLSSASVALMSVIQTPAQAVVLYGVLFALATAGTSIAPIGVMISRWFPKHLGLANSIAISGMGAGQLVIILLALPLVIFIQRQLKRERLILMIISLVIAHTGLHWTVDRWQLLSAYF